ncbi:N-acetylmuramoyl-L-alanine amidase [Bacillus sp. FJAT-44742]|uniref:N-acetylmuramoyl-L-alanine amidase n=1 Tax=Bacillus sp. FJAT-44742 TaxID=2014005 RepID=UPI000C23E674|nr:N-acetylmuramoyl-L-alanine amidase [Bacillus sp. FJAT-44742]
MINKRLQAFLIFSVALLFIFSFSSQSAEAAERIAGDNRIETAIEISQYGWNSSDHVVLARADHPADALASASLLSTTEAPILLTDSSSIDLQVINEIHRLGASHVYILGGPHAISHDVEGALTYEGLQVTRVEGDNRYQTAEQVNREAGYINESTAILVSGEVAADALSASGMAANEGYPIYLSRATSMPVDLPSSVSNVIIFGGPSAISESVENQLVNEGRQVERIQGDNRYQTSVAAAERANLAGNHNIVVRGTSVRSDTEDYPDAVASAGLANRLNASVILTHHDSPRNETLHYVQNSGNQNLVLGGPAAVSDSAVEALSETSPSSPGEITQTGIITGVQSSLNVRSQPSTSSSILGGLPNGTEIDIYEEDGSWAKIDFGGDVGYVSMTYVSISEPTYEATGTVSGVQNSLNVRSQPSGSSSIIGGLSNGTSLDIYEIDGNWAKIDYNGDIGYVSMTYVSLNTSSEVLHGQTIAIDPGHGGRDPGAEANGLQEKEIALDVGLRVQEKLESAGANVIMTRTTDVYVSLQDRATIANNADASSFVSIHTNAFNSEAQGTETYHYPGSEDGERLAEAIQEEMLAALETNDRGVKDARFSVLRNTTMPAALAELAFTDHPDDAEKLRSNTYRERAADAIVRGLERFYSE